MHIFAFLLLIILSAGDAIAAKRVALVMGNGAYHVQPRLRNPVGDAKAIADVLRQTGFEVTLGTDLTNQGMRETINRFAASVPGADAALLFYAGHGVQVDGENYLIPIDATIERVADLTWQTVPVSVLVSELELQGRTSIIILDACRNNAGLTRRLRGMTSRSRTLTVSQGLAEVAVPNGAYVAFSTAPHTIALDGDGKNSPFTTALLKHMPTVGLDIALMMRRVRRDVRRMTNRQQTPWDSSSLTQPFYFVPANNAPATAKPEATQQPPSKSKPMSQRDAFAATRSIGTCKAYDYFLQEYGNGFLSNLAKAWKAKNCTPQNRDLVTMPSPSQKLPPSPELKPLTSPAQPSRQATGKSSTKRAKSTKPRSPATTARTRSKRRPAGQSKSCFTDCVAACYTFRNCEWECSRQC